MWHKASLLCVQKLETKVNKFLSVYLRQTHNVGDCRTENSVSVPLFKIRMHSNFNTRKKLKEKKRYKLNKEI